MVAMKPREKDETTKVTEKSKTFGTVSTKTEEATQEATASQDKRGE